MRHPLPMMRSSFAELPTPRLKTPSWNAARSLFRGLDSAIRDAISARCSEAGEALDLWLARRVPAFIPISQYDNRLDIRNGPARLPTVRSKTLRSAVHRPGD